MNKVGKKTPVWLNTKTGEVRCGSTIQDALGVGWLSYVSPDWVQVSEVPKAKRVIIDEHGFVLPENDFTVAIAAVARCSGRLTVQAYGCEHTVEVAYCDSTRVILR